MKTIVITGGSSGLGYKIISEIIDSGLDFYLHNLDVKTDHEFDSHISYKYHPCDVSSGESVAKISSEIILCDILINCAGINYINWLELTPDAKWEEVIGANAKGIFNTAKHFMHHLKYAKGTILNIVSNASHMPMTNSICYNASKGAAHIMTLQLARELGAKGITVFGISPNKLSDTGMSNYIDKTVPGLRGWSEEFAREYQLKGLPAGEETDPTVLAEFILFLLSKKQRHKYLAGCVIPYGA